MEKSESTMETRPNAPPLPDAPSPSSAPPSYEEAIGAYNSLQNTVPYQANQPRRPGPHPQSSNPPFVNPDGTTNTYAVQAPTRTEVRVLRQSVPYALGPSPVKMQCPLCMASIKTSTVSQRQPSAHICCIILCVLGCCLCSCLPYCMSAFLTVNHYCPNCTAYIGTWKG